MKVISDVLKLVTPILYQLVVAVETKTGNYNRCQIALIESQLANLFVSILALFYHGNADKLIGYNKALTTTQLMRSINTNATEGWIRTTEYNAFIPI